MAVIKAVSSKVSIGQALDYVMKQEKTESKLITGLGCEAETVKEKYKALPKAERDKVIAFLKAL